MKHVQTLIALAREKVGGTDAALARALGMKPPDWHPISKGLQPVSPEVCAALCDVLQLPGEEAREWLAVAVIENPKNASRVEVLKRALFACWALGVFALTMPNDARAAADLTTGRQYIETLGGYRSLTHGLYIVMHLVWRRLCSFCRLLNVAGATTTASRLAIGGTAD